ncbi:Narbonolide/10-deoxymethynolide synthase PikA1, modules 1 and 2 [BD1-7 clade bacterium]|uniref:Narbonolide/10-deoxymethynolide synthase PikA1, modules 1 and 2 n=1 Tax=BD1-7 clade bacterium TaxID=2029982 RepID=A0A5S9MPR8_9GAMM|nr:Narbonolide/10-deoxymethynolide synthase PikA1, modules 1 and 2 [BD1-7 clade bacterium]
MPEELSFQKKLLQLIDDQDQRIRELESATSEPIAIVGMACRLPGGIKTPDDFWQLLLDGRDATEKVPMERWDADALFDQDPDAFGKTYCTRGGFVHGIDLFDAGFFGINAQEAAAMDPQQRLLLELSWQSLEHAGIVPSALKGTETGVFIGLMGAEYDQLRQGNVQDLDGYRLNGVSAAAASGRLAYFMGLKGPCMTIDTACSSSLVSLHLACNALREKECNLSLCGGASLQLTPDLGIEFCRLRGAAADGRCKSFADQADGAGWSDGAGMLVLKRLSDAQRDGDRVLAVVRGSAVNHDGRSTGFTVPNGPSQERVIRKALLNAGLTVDDMDFIEAHGTGTRLGDPIEAGALAEVFRQRQAPLYLGSAKSNLGHTMAAAGVTGIIKSVLSLQAGHLPQTLHCQDPSQHIDWQDSPLILLQTATVLPALDRPYRGGISSFGASGTNAHVVLESAPISLSEEPAAETASPIAGDWRLIPVSGQTRQARMDQAQQLQQFINEQSAVSLMDLSFNLGHHRSAFDDRAVCIVQGEDPAALQDCLTAIAAGSEHPMVIEDSAKPSGKTCFVFPGQGSQWLGMARELLAQPAFAASLKACDEALAPYLDWHVQAVLAGQDTQHGLEDVDVIQPVLFAVFVSLAAYWRSLGVEPDAVVGHSQGEVAAACVAGILSLDEAARVVSARSQQVKSLAGTGGMTLVKQSAEAVQQRLARHDLHVTIAVINAPTETVVSGSPDELTILENHLSQDNVFYRRVNVDYASHGDHIDALQSALLDAFGDIQPATTAIAYYSATQGQRLDGSALTAQYWFDNLRRPVNFMGAIDQLINSGYSTFLEISAHPVLTTALQAIVEDRQGQAIVGWSLERDENDQQSMAKALARLFCQGYNLNWQHLLPAAKRLEHLPSYAFQRQRYWCYENPQAGSWTSTRIPLTELQWLAQPPQWPASALAIEQQAAPDITPQQLTDWLTTASEQDCLVLRWPQELGGLLNTEVIQHAANLLRVTVQHHRHGSLVWVTQGAYTIAGDQHPISAMARGLWGLVKTAHVEHATCPIAIMDTDNDDPLAPEVLQWMVQQTDHGALYRQERCWLGRLVETPTSPSPHVIDNPEQGSYLITGGLGGIGRVMARWLVEQQGVKHIALCSRQGLATVGADAFVATLASAGADVRVYACDCADRQQLHTLIETIHNHQPLRGIFHTAGVYDACPTEALDDTAIEATFAAKVDSAWALHDITQAMGIPLEIFSLCSSTSALLGGVPGGAIYAAANQCLDALAEHRHQQGLAATAVQWGYWRAEGLGMAASLDDAHMDKLAAQGLLAIDATIGQQLLSRLMGLSDRAVVCGQPFDVERLQAFWGTGLPGLYQKLVPSTTGPSSIASDESASSQWLTEWYALEAADRKTRVDELVADHIRTVLGFSEFINPDKGLSEYGLDSLKAVDIRNRIVKATGLTLPVNLMFDYPTLNALTSYLYRQMAGDTAAISSSPGERNEHSDDAVAIIGMACRTPGGGNTPQAFWQILESGVDCIADFPANRWDIDALFEPDRETRKDGTVYCKSGGYLGGIDQFDARFFGINRIEADSLDPNQRLLLEMAWESMEDAGVIPDHLYNANAGVFVGLTSPDYGWQNGGNPASINPYSSTGVMPNCAAGRLAFTFGLRGPCLSVDTACSSSLSSLHLACMSLRNSECDIAFSGGVAVQTSPRTLIEMCNVGATSPDGRCRAFGDDANGAGWSDGAGMLMLKRLSDAQHDGDHIYAVIRATAMSQDGRSSGLTVPNGPAQQAAIKDALSRAALTIDDVDYIEAHGTGTPLGDPIEAGALTDVFQTRNEPLYLGTVKSNLGHTQAASGVVGVIKTVLSMQHGVIPQSLHTDVPSSHIDWEQTPLCLAQHNITWPDTGRARRAGVSSFGVSGTNVHAILEHSPDMPESHVDNTPACDDTEIEAVSPLGNWILLPLSAKSASGLPQQASQLASFIRTSVDVSLRDIAYMLSVHRSAFDYRVACIVKQDDRDGALERLQALANDEFHERVVAGRVVDTSKTCLVFPGQGSQWLGMGIELLHNPVFAASIDQCERALSNYVPWSLRDVLMGVDDEFTLDQVDVVQPVLFSVFFSLAAVWESISGRPDAVIGHSQGEVAAACVAGILSLDDAIRIVTERSRAVKSLRSGSSMTMVKMNRSDAIQLLEEKAIELTVAVENAPMEIVVAGNIDELERFESLLESKQFFWRRINVDYASHTASIEQIEGVLLEAFGKITPQQSDVVFYSATRGGKLHYQDLGASYWYENLRRPVEFRSAIEEVLAGGTNRVVEISAHPVLAQALLSISESLEQPLALTHCLERERDGCEIIAQQAARYWALGGVLNFSHWYPGAERVLGLPTYCFQRQRYWLPDEALQLAGTGQVDSGHPLLGIYQPGIEQGQFIVDLLKSGETWLTEHRLNGQSILPLSALLEMMNAAAAFHQRYLSIKTDITLSDISLSEPLLIPTQASHCHIVVQQNSDAASMRVSIHSKSALTSSDWRLHASAEVVSSAPSYFSSDAIWQPDGDDLSVAELHKRVEKNGVIDGPSFGGLQQVLVGEHQAWGYIELPAQLSSAEYGVHPCLLGAAMQLMGAMITSEYLYMPFGAKRCCWTDKPETACFASVRVQSTDEQKMCDFAFYDRDERIIGELSGLLLKPVSDNQLAGLLDSHSDVQKASGLYDIQWRVHPGTEDRRSAVAVGDIVRLRLSNNPDEPTVLFENARTVVIDWPSVDSMAAVHTLLHKALDQLQQLSREEGQCALIWLTHDVFPQDHASTHPLSILLRGLWGMARSALAENPQLRLCLIDVEGVEVPDEDTCRQLLSDNGFQGHEYRWQQGKWYTPYLTDAHHADAGSVLVRASEGAIRSDGTVVITGGFGALARHAVRWLINQHAIRHVTLVSRSPANTDSRMAFLEEVQELGCEVDVQLCDVSDADAVAVLLKETNARSPVRGIIHTAVVLADRLLLSMTAADIETSLGAKVDGAWHLHQYSIEQSLDLDCFFMYSALAAWIGYPGLANYCAANLCLDALADLRTSMGLPAKSIAWGYWHDESSDMLSHFTTEDYERFQGRGFVPITPARGSQLLESALETSSTCVMAAPLDVQVLAKYWSDHPGLVRTLFAHQDAPQASTSVPDWQRLDEAERIDGLSHLITKTLSNVLGIAPASIQDEQPFASLGMDSMMAVEIRNRLSRLTGKTLAANTLFDYPTLQRLRAHLESLFTGSSPLSAKNQPIKRRGTDDIAIIGMSCKLPGGIETTEAFWKLLEDGGDIIDRIPMSRWDVSTFYDPDPEHAGSTCFTEGGFFDRVDLFDAGFFRINRREADTLDPQQRFVLESVWTAFEDAGIPPSSLNNRSVGVYLGAAYNGYEQLGVHDFSDPDLYTTTGSASCTLSGRVSFSLGLTGPSMTIDTGCSSSLVGLHQACQSLREGESELAIAGGVSLMVSPISLVKLSRLGASSPDGRCKAFAEGADGAGWGEACGILVLKRLGDAERDGDRVLAVIKGSAINQDGRSAGLTVPNGPAQQRVITQALANAGVNPDDIDYVETHGTGTELGDPIEAKALSQVFLDRSEPLYIGSVKSNIGHTMAAAGVMGLMKTVLGLSHGKIPKTLHADVPTTLFDWPHSSLALAPSTLDWRAANDSVRRAGISSFGISGTNAHVVLESSSILLSEEPAAETASPIAGDWRLIPVSGQTRQARMDQAQQLQQFINEQSAVSLMDLSFNLGHHRSAFDDRAVCIVQGEDPAALQDCLTAIAAGSEHPMVIEDSAKPSGKTCFVFPGQGSQWLGMARELLAQPAFAASLKACDEALAPYLDWHVQAVLAGQDTQHGLEDVDVIQPVLFAVFVSLAAYWRSLGVEPDAVVGHSQGEVAAACVAGILSLDEAARVVSARSQQVKSLAGTGGMTLVKQSAEAVQQRLARHDLHVTIAVINAPTETVVSGSPDELTILENHLSQDNVFYRRVNVDYASHGDHIDALQSALLDAFGDIQPATTAIAYYSATQGQRLDGSALTAQYWFDNLRRPVNFMGAIDQLINSGYSTFLEISAHPVLTTALQAIVEDRQGQAIVGWSLERDENDQQSMAKALARLFCQGYNLNWQHLLPAAKRLEHLPSYAFQRQRYWCYENPQAGSWTSTRIPLTELQWLAQPPQWPASALAIEQQAAPDITPQQLTDWLTTASEQDCLVLRWPQELGGLLNTEVIQHAANLLRVTVQHHRHGSLVWVTQGAYTIAGDQHPISAMARGLWGLVKTAHVEHATCPIAIMDTDNDDPLAPEVLQWMVQQTDHGALYRQERCWLGRLVETPTSPSPHVIDNPEQGSYLITGGLGGIGRVMARWLVEQQGVKHIALCSRQGLATVGADAFVATLASAGADVRVYACDCADRQQLHTLIETIHNHQPLRGIFHTAGVYDACPTEALDDTAIEATFAAKVDSAWALHDITQAMGIPLEIFSLCSSTSALLGGVPGGAIYAAANQCLDALAEHRHQQGLAATAVQWGYWRAEGLGMAASLDDAHMDKLAAQGLLAIDATIGQQLLSRLMGLSDRAVVCGQPFDVERLQAFWGTGLPGLYQKLVPSTTGPSSIASDESASSQWLTEWYALEAADRKTRVDELVADHIRTVLGYAITEADRLRPFSELGMDSLTAVQIRNRLCRDIDRPLPINLLFDHSNIVQLTNYLVDAVLSEEVAQDVAQPYSMTGLQSYLLALLSAADVDVDKETLRHMSDILKAHIQVRSDLTDDASSDPDLIDEISDEEAMRLLKQRIDYGK